MAEPGEWNQKGASLSDVTALKEYGVDRAFIVKGIRAGALEYRQGSMHGNPYLKVLRGQLEGYIAKKQGARHLAEAKHAAELRKISSEITSLKRRLTALQKRKVELESGKS